MGQGGAVVLQDGFRRRDVQADLEEDERKVKEGCGRVVDL